MSELWKLSRFIFDSLLFTQTMHCDKNSSAVNSKDFMIFEQFLEQLMSVWKFDGLIH